MQCRECSAELIAGKRFCHSCGAEVGLRCGACGAGLEASYRHCPDCGTRVDAGAPPPGEDRLARLATNIPEELAQKIRASSPSISGERKLVTVLFCDLVGSTAMGERLDPEDFHDLLEKYLELVFREVYRCEGIVTHLAGDGVMALFGAPVAHENAPYRAVRVALAIRESLDEFNREVRERRGLELQTRMGVNTGPVVVGTVGNDLKMDYTAIGDTTNLAARLQSLGAPGSILLSEATYRRVRGFFEMKRVGEFQVKGKAEPVTAYEVLASSEAATRMDVAAARGLTPLVGRRAEMLQLMTCYERLADGLGQVVTVVGDAGSGKSRLLYELRQQLAGEEAIFLEARCSALSYALPGAPWRSMLAQFFELDSTSPEPEAVQRIADRVRPFDPELTEIFPYLCRLLSVSCGSVGDLPAEELKRQTFEAMAHLVGGLSHQAPVVVIFEDLHWIDDTSREMLDLAAARLGKGRVMLLATHRPDHHPTWRTPAASTQLNLRPLSDEEITEVIRAQAGGLLPAEMEGLIRLKAEGNPFFAEEFTRALVEEGYVVRDEGGVRLTCPADQIPIPGTVEEVIGARIDRLGPHAKRVVQVASVLGRQFHRRLLAQLLAGEEIDVAAQLERLERHGVIHRKALLSGDEFRFGESLTQQVAYESLLMRERRQLHERVGALLEDEPGELNPERSALLAHHFARSDNRDKAVAALLSAAEHAADLPSYPTAAELFRQAWQAAEAALQQSGGSEGLQRLAVRAAIGLGRMRVIYSFADDDEAVHATRRGRELAEALGDLDSVAACLTFEGMVIMSGDRARFAEGLELVEQGLTAAQAAGNPLTVNSISRGLAWSYLYDGHCQQALSVLDGVIEALEASGHRQALSDLYLGARSMRDGSRYVADDLEAARRGALDLFELARQVSNRTVSSHSAATLAAVAFARAEYAEARNWAERAIETAAIIGNMGAARTAACVLMGARTELGEPLKLGVLIPLIEQDGGGAGDLANKGNLIVDALAAAGEAARARRLLEAAYAHAGGRLREANCAAAIGHSLLRQEPPAFCEAERWLEKSLALAREIGHRSTAAVALLGIAEVAGASADRQRVAQALGEALAISRSLGLKRLQGRVESLAELLGSSGTRLPGCSDQQLSGP